MASSVHFNKGDRIIQEGQTSDCLYLVKEGMLEIQKVRAGRTVTLGHIREGELVGEISFLTEEPRSASVLCKTDVELVEIPAEVFAKAMADLPNWFQVLIKALADRLRKTSNMIKT